MKRHAFAPGAVEVHDRRQRAGGPLEIAMAATLAFLGGFWIGWLFLAIVELVS